MRYWIEGLNNRNICPFDHHPLREINYELLGEMVFVAKECSFCAKIFLPYVSAEVAIKWADINTSSLSNKEIIKIQTLRKEANSRESKRIEAQKRAELAYVRRKKAEEVAKKQRIKEQQQRELAILQDKRNEFKRALETSFDEDFLSSENFFEKNNSENLLHVEDFYQLRESYVDKWFKQNTPASEYTPDREQIAAIASTYKNVEVVARAGSGKSSTIVNRFRFLTEHCHVEAASILILAFNKKAVKELHDKIENLFCTHEKRKNNMPHVMTFHALAYSVVSPREDIIYDDEDGAKTLSKTVQDIIDEKLRDLDFSSKVKQVMLTHFKGNWEAIEKYGYNLSIEKQLSYLRSLPRQTLKGEYVKSYGEKVIANALFEHDIDYSYEKPVGWYDGTVYRPDFTIDVHDKKKIIIEYFGLAGNREYDQQIESKRNFWDKKEDVLLEFYPSDFASGQECFIKNLLERLRKERIPYRKLSEEEIWERIKGRAIDEFTKAIKSFIDRCRKQELSSENLRELIQSYNCDLDTEKTFLEIAHNVYDDYLSFIENNHKEDFNGLMSRARKYIQDGKTAFDKWDNRGDLKDLRFIMIDEYQDFSFLFDIFLKTIRSVCPTASIFCVGDDWQAINAFAGSNVQYFQKFLEMYDLSKRYYLKTNYRSTKEIVCLGTKLMAPGKSTEDITAYRQGNSTIRIAYPNSFRPSPSEQDTYGADYFTPAILRLVSSILAENKRVVFLTRTNERIPYYFNSHANKKDSGRESFLASIQSFFTPEQRKLISASTTHKYKGKEEDAVIVLDAINGYYPLVHPAWIFQRVFGDTLEKIYEEEKRLFYVAISRAKNDLYILTSRGDESPFLKCLGDINKLDWDDFAPLKTAFNEIRVIVCNQSGYGTAPTISIKEELKKEFTWNASKQLWHRSYARNKYDLTKIFSQSWTRKANHVCLLIENENGQVEDTYLFVDGTPHKVTNIKH